MTPDEFVHQLANLMGDKVIDKFVAYNNEFIYRTASGFKYTYEEKNTKTKFVSISFSHEAKYVYNIHYPPRTYIASQRLFDLTALELLSYHDYQSCTRMLIMTKRIKEITEWIASYKENFTLYINLMR